MTVKEYYDAIGGDYDEVMSRLPRSFDYTKQRKVVALRKNDMEKVLHWQGFFW